jgi:glucose/mannose-6-phosphate isomerase
MLDDLKMIHERDAQDALGIAEKQWQQYKQSYNFSGQPPHQVTSVVVVGMGGSGLAAKLVRSWPGVPIPYEVAQGYDLPEHANQSTLAVFSSYSGNTEEVLSAFDQAMSRPEGTRPMVVVVASGGKLIELAQQHSLPYIQLPGAYQPRMTLGFQLRALLEILEASGVVRESLAQLDAAGDWLHGQMNTWLPTEPSKSNLAKQIALDVIGKSVVVYAGPKLAPAAYKWKISFNENAKHIAWWNEYSELNHNEFIGWSKQPVDKPYAVIELRSSLEHPQIQKRFTVTERLLSGMRPAPIVVTPQGGSLLEQLVWIIALGDFVSLYTALLNGINPTPVDLVEKLKVELAK